MQCLRLCGAITVIILDYCCVCVCVFQLIHVYSVPTNDVLALPVVQSVTEGQPASLSLMIQITVHIERSDQVLLTPAGAVVDLHDDPSQYCTSQVYLLLYQSHL